MINTVKYILYKPIHIGKILCNKKKLSISYGILVFAFLNVFKPFKLYLLNEYFTGYIIAISTIYILVLYILFIILQKINYKKWNLIKILYLYIFYTIILTYFSWKTSIFYKEIYNYPNKLSFIIFYKYTLYLSFISTPLMFVINKYINKIKAKKKVLFEKKTTIYSDNKKEEISINFNKLIYISITGNYASFFVIIDNEIKELILRNTLTNILKQIKKRSNIFRCHKSYIVNSDFINSFSGNTRGYYIKMERIDFKIPVSRKYSKEDLEELLK